MGTTILRLPQVKSRSGLSRSAIYAKLRPSHERPGDYDPTFPVPVAIGARAVGWVEAELEIWLRTRVQKRRRGVQDGQSATPTDRARTK
ncbi:MAG: AlpA family phage regulatory protein [Verrucomicrobia bacterium]|nr:AlpA family phage regulatory protein [Verrucomicrobiota bacterium]MDA0983517.1 AlpA family phage regulatory protein [Pseudomonadota bacterium]